jgi:cytochrome P450
MVFRDPPDHGRLRKLVHQAFTMRGVETLAGSVAEVVASRIDALRTAGEGDFLSLVAGPIPAIVIARLLGVPAEDHERFREWSDEVVMLVFGNVGDPDRHVRAQGGLLALERYFRALLDERRRRPTDDLLSALSRAEEAGDRLSSDEVIANCILLLFAGHETTTNLLANGMLAMLEHPEAWRTLRDDPSLAANAVEECLRFEGPSKAMMRFVVADLEIGGRLLRKGERVLLVQAAANRDPERYADPDRFDVRRDFDEHVGFGYGIHYCLGAPLARLEGRIAFAAFARELGAIELAGVPEWQPLIVSRGLSRLPVRLARSRQRIAAAT